MVWRDPRLQVVLCVCLCYGLGCGEVVLAATKMILRLSRDILGYHAYTHAPMHTLIQCLLFDIDVEYMLFFFTISAIIINHCSVRYFLVRMLVFKQLLTSVAVM